MNLVQMVTLEDGNEEVFWLRDGDEVYYITGTPVSGKSKCLSIGSASSHNSTRAVGSGHDGQQYFRQSPLTQVFSWECDPPICVSFQQDIRSVNDEYHSTIQVFKLLAQDRKIDVLTKELKNLVSQDHQALRLFSRIDIQLTYRTDKDVQSLRYSISGYTTPL